MKRIDIEKVRIKNDYLIDSFIGGLKMEFIKNGKNYIIKDSNGRVVSEEEKLKLEKKEMVLKDIKSNECQEETTKKIKKIDKKIKQVKKIEKAEDTEKVEEALNDTIEETDNTL